MNVFYSWQSDSPNSTNRGLINKSLNKAALVLRRDQEISIEPVIDRDTENVPGSPNIAKTILEKIENSQVFVGDVSIINPNSNGRKTPNPNVLIELGFAVKCLGTERIILIQNTAFGGPENLPFDLKMNRVVTYSSNPDDSSRNEAHNILTKKLEGALRSVAGLPQSPHILIQFGEHSTGGSLGSHLEMDVDYLYPKLNRDRLRPATQFGGFMGILDTGLLMNPSYYEDLINFVSDKALLRPVNLTVTNGGGTKLSEVEVQIKVIGPRGLSVADSSAEPERPSRDSPRFKIRSPILSSSPSEPTVERLQDYFNISFGFQILQPRVTKGIDSPLYVGSPNSGTTNWEVMVFAAELTEPIRQNLSIQFTAKRREMTIEDIKKATGGDY